MQINQKDATFFCGLCSEATFASRKAFKPVDLGALVRCSWCKKSNVSTSWTCKCEIPWHLCNTHKQLPEKIRRRKQGETEAGKTKRQRVPADGKGKKQRCVMKNKSVVFTLGEKKGGKFLY